MPQIDESSLPLSPRRIWARYWLETAFPVEKAVEALAGEQSSGTFVKLPGETEQLRQRAGARIERLELLDSVASPSLPGARMPKGSSGYQRALADVSWPLENLGPSLPNLLATVAGNLFELQQFSGLRLLDVSLPDAFLSVYSGPQFGVSGTRKLASVYNRPLIGTIVKPSVGLSPEETASLACTLAEAGIDFIKDDELQADGPHCPFNDRVTAVMRVLNQNADRTGKKVMFAFNLTGEIDEMLRRHDHVVAQGGTCIMVSLNSIGLPALAYLRRHSALPIHCHRNGWGLFSRSPHIGMSYVAWQKFWRVAGADHMHVNGLRNKFCEPDESVLASARACLAPVFLPPAKGCEVMPVFSSGQTVHQAPDTLAGLGSTDLIFAAGGGLMAHPDGVAAGVAAIRQAWEAATARGSLTEWAKSHTELRRAMEAYAK
jgi:ribulose-bisphosphate carboxylase large chain